MTIFSPVVAFLLLVSSALVLDAAIYFRRNEKEFDDGFFVICKREPCGNVEAAGVSISNFYSTAVTKISSCWLKFHKYWSRWEIKKLRISFHFLVL